ncbi:hypothetical protein FIBSPDRAFT_854239 [Athelia psychrophila]|uniref:Uncharacterized protein n=1 Tax=Athelia psychrophila TaxID=1759441 RepID=A0A166Q907_9AGAM|nr:hypothetical protein FIBSPDRAFT_854239 [Fibularhizoctonia sp. CBS 109695]
MPGDEKAQIKRSQQDLISLQMEHGRKHPGQGDAHRHAEQPARKLIHPLAATSSARDAPPPRRSKQKSAGGRRSRREW